jgi:arsenate reductase
MRKPSVLFVCTHNSARSQLAEGLLREFHGDRYEARSAGTEETRVKPEAAAALEELGIDTSPLFSKTLEYFDADPADYVITVCDSAREACPWVSAKVLVVHRPFGDPSDVTESAEARMDAFRAAREDIRAWLDGVFGAVPPDFE